MTNIETNAKCNVPILLIIFNRIDTLQVLFNIIKQQKPRYLYVAADGPRPYINGEEEKCMEARSIIEQIDWDCEVKTFFRDDNSGSAGVSVSSAITWFFEQVEFGIIFEHDVIPHPDYFYFCQELLEKYKDDERVCLINGVNFQDGQKRGDGSYYFSLGSSNWGFATWRRTWQHYDLALRKYSYKSFKADMDYFHLPWKMRLIRNDLYKLLKAGKIDDWAFQTGFLMFQLRSLCIVPNVNLISNIGGGKDAYNLKDEKDWRLNRPIYPILPVTHPSKVERDIEADNYSIKTISLHPTVYFRGKAIRLSINTFIGAFIWFSWRCFRRNFVAPKKVDWDKILEHEK